MTDEMLRVEGLRVHFFTLSGIVRAVDGVSFSLQRGERLGLAGESGSGKSTTALALMRLIKEPGRIVDGHIYLAGEDLAKVSEERMRAIRLSEIALIPQGAMNSLNPVAKIKNQIIDGLLDHGFKKARKDMEEWARELLQRVGLEPEVGGLYPHELSGGMKQRVAIAIAISLNPKIIIADEPTSALDVVVQQQIIETLQRLQEEIGASVVLIGHDMGLMAQVVDRLGVMYAGRLAEIGTVRQVIKGPVHPYSSLLIESLPSLEAKGALKGIAGIPPSLMAKPEGCPFHPRCPRVMEICSQQEPTLETVDDGRSVSCFLYANGSAETSRVKETHAST